MTDEGQSHDVHVGPLLSHMWRKDIKSGGTELFNHSTSSKVYKAKMQKAVYCITKSSNLQNNCLILAELPQKTLCSDSHIRYLWDFVFFVFGLK